MRYYSIQVEGREWTSLVGGRTDPGALNVELDLPIYYQDQGMGAPSVRIWGIALEDISQSQDFVNKRIKVYGGMAPGLPLATAQSSEAGLLVDGRINQSFANWIGTDMTLDFLIVQDTVQRNEPAPFARNPPDKNLVLNWKKGMPLQGPLQQALTTGFPGMPISMAISSGLVAPQDNVGYYANLSELAQYIREVSQTIMGGDNYQGVGIALQKGKITVDDGTSPSGSKQIAYTDLIGQPTWIRPAEISIKTVMRGDILVGYVITLPPARIIKTGAAGSGLSGPLGQLTFQGTFKVANMRHMGNFRQPDAASWVTVIEAVSGSI